jgi:hypothetical protein
VSLRSGLLAGRRVALAGTDLVLRDRLRRLGAETETIDADRRDDEERAAAWVTDQAPLDALVFDAREDFGSGGYDGLRSALDQAWICARAVSTGALIGTANGGRLLFVAPPAEAGPLASGARSGLESLARTLSVEWARHTVTAVAVCPGASTSEDELAELAAFVLSPAGGYFSGCRFDLGQITAVRS